MRILKTLPMALFIFLASSVSVLAQAGEELAEPINWLKFVALAITGVLVPIAVELLKQYWSSMPAIVKTIAALVAGSLIMALQVFLSEKLGWPVDLSLLEQFFAGATMGLAASRGFATGKKAR